ncbi:hypothetical protein T06_15048 [Trichinella sp. T6]|nr:hypothetical protein T06_15048 [Trichinella sp. T6]
MSNNFFTSFFWSESFKEFYCPDNVNLNRLKDFLLKLFYRQASRMHYSCHSLIQSHDKKVKN